MSRMTHTKTIITCDRCGATDEGDAFRRGSAAVAVLRTVRDARGNGAGGRREYDLCSVCADGLDAFMRETS